MRGDALRRLIKLGEQGQVPSGCELRAAAVDLVDFLDQPPPDRRRVATFDRGRAIERLLARGLAPRTIRERLGLSEQAYYRALRVCRESRPGEAIQRDQARRVDGR